MQVINPVLKSIGQRLQNIRKAIHINQKDFAREMEISGASLSEIEAGSAKPRIEVYYNLTRKYNVNIDYLFHGKGEMFRSPDQGGTAGIDREDEFREFLETFLDYFEKSRLVRYSVMTHFTTFLEEKETLIEKNIKKNKTMKQEVTTNEN
ncbi:MAG: helix-turn-helix transcriptional regulator [Candidatus Aminicenantes bacterium]|jgi:transcriptional regulator with XRE-family HTH domain